MVEYWRFHQSIAAHHVIVMVQQLPIQMNWIRILGMVRMVNELLPSSRIGPRPDGQNGQEKAAE